MRTALITLGTLLLVAGCSAGLPSAVTRVSAPNETQNKTKPQRYIYVTQYANNSLAKYTRDGVLVWSITAGLASPEGVAVDHNGKIYVANGNDTVTTYDQNGNQTTPTITTGLDLPFGVAVDAAGKIYVTNLANNTVTTYGSDGTQTKPTIHGLDGVGGVAVDTAGKIYVVDSGNNSVNTYKPSGRRTHPTITAGLHQPIDVKVARDGKIWVSSYKPAAITSYTARGKQVNPTITQGLDGLYCIAISPERVYAANRRGSNVTTYMLNGYETPPTIDGLNYSLTGVAFH